ncbi:MAG: sigma-54-dependent Fis family transcriptional regulator [Myxococcales bacterium]|nr:sigma-54-dependent Fis family transcriptional regulator [Myxococcales bacterium]MCB9522698.1 sigma-54-dependent Fis family transcriptional regulator [Myxococcales bacterium]
MTTIGQPYDEDDQTRVVVIDDETPILKAWRWMLHGDEFGIEGYTRGKDAIEAIGNRPIDVVVTDVKMPGMSGFDVLAWVKKERPDIEVLVMTGAGSIPDAVRAMQSGAFDYLTKPFTEIEECINKVRQAARLKRLRAENRALRERVDAPPESILLDSRSQAMKSVLTQIDQYARVDANVLVMGPVGAGKGVVARTIHQRSARREQPFVPVDCASIAPDRLEAELLGYEPGALPGARDAAPGLFELAHRGTLFLDELDRMPEAMQVLVLKVLESGSVQRVGAAEPTPVDVRVISATARDLGDAVEDGDFRADLYFRLKLLTVKVPPLNERPEDIPRLAYSFLRRAARRLGKEVETIAPEAMALLEGHDWKGNLRELDQVLEAGLVFETGPELTVRHLPEELTGTQRSPINSLAAQVDLDLPFREAVERAERTFRITYLTGLMSRFRSVSAAARHAQMDRANFRRMLRRYDITDYPKGDG